MTEWTCVLQLDSQRKRVSGSKNALRDAIYAGADLRVGTEFLHNEHVDTGSECNEKVREVMDFRVTYLLEKDWVAGVETLRMPIALPDGFGTRAVMAFVLYNQDGQSAKARSPPDGYGTTG